MLGFHSSDRKNCLAIVANLAHEQIPIPRSAVAVRMQFDGDLVLRHLRNLFGSHQVKHAASRKLRVVDLQATRQFGGQGVFLLRRKMLRVDVSMDLLKQPARIGDRNLDFAFFRAEAC